MNLKLIDFVTCKLVFPAGTTKAQLETLLEKHAKGFSIANFYPEAEMGCNKVAMAVVDIPEKAVHDLYNESVVKHVDLMTSYGKRPSNAEDCGSGCGCAPRG